MSTRHIAASLALAATLAMSPKTPVISLAPTAVHNIVLVHGAFADGSSWSKVIPLLTAKGYRVTAVQNPLTSLADDVSATERAIAVQDGPVILVGHSWAGMVITEAGNDPKVVGLVYVAAFAPDDGQSIAETTKGFPAAPGLGEAKPDASGFLSLTKKGVDEYFAPDLSAAQRALVYATQGPWNSKALNNKITRAAWKTKPSWYIAVNDRMISPEYERARAQQINATTTNLNTNHVAMLSQPRAVAAVIVDAASKAMSQNTAPNMKAR